MISVARSCAFGFVAAALAPGAGDAKAPFQTRPVSGERLYHYEVREIAPDSTKGYRTDFRLVTSDDGAEIAHVIKSESLEKGTWSAVTVDTACAATLHAGAGELAAIKLNPLSPEEAKLGDAFMPTCAPAGLFFPMTDILNVVLIQSSDVFHIEQLDRAGASVSFGGFATNLSRPGISMKESSDGGTITLVSLQDGKAVIDWKPLSAKLDLQEGNLPLIGTEHFAFRLVVDAKTGVLEHAEALYDDLDIVPQLPNVPADKLPHVSVRREVTIQRADDAGPG